MADGRRNNGGHSTKGRAGRKPKADERKLIELLSPLEPQAHKALKNALKAEEKWAVELYFKYCYGLPKQMVDVTSNGNQINIPPLMWEDDK